MGWGRQGGVCGLGGCAGAGGGIGVCGLRGFEGERGWCGGVLRLLSMRLCVPTRNEGLFRSDGPWQMRLLFMVVAAVSCRFFVACTSRRDGLPLSRVGQFLSCAGTSHTGHCTAITPPVLSLSNPQWKANAIQEPRPQIVCLQIARLSSAF